jgi:hypothetical protein
VTTLGYFTQLWPQIVPSRLLDRFGRGADINDVRGVMQGYVMIPVLSQGTGRHEVAALDFNRIVRGLDKASPTGRLFIRLRLASHASGSTTANALHQIAPSRSTTLSSSGGKRETVASLRLTGTIRHAAFSRSLFSNVTRPFYLRRLLLIACATRVPVVVG